MAYQDSRKKWLKGDNLTILQKNILQVAQSIRKEQKTFNMVTLFEICCKKLPNPEPEIYQAIRELYSKKFIVEGKQLFKQEVLTNEKRNKINGYINKYPGAHIREIRKVFDLGAYMAYRHLAILEKFEFLRKSSYRNKIVYFPSDFKEDQELAVLLLRNETTNRIFECIQEHGKLRVTELKEIIQIPYTTIQDHLKRLIEGGLVEKIKKDQTSYYVLAEEEGVEEKIRGEKEKVAVKREFDYVGGNIRFKVAVRNLTNMAVHNIAVNLNPSEQFIADVPQQNVANLPPNSTRGIDFILTPLTCGQSTIFGAVSFQDAFGQVHSIPIQQKEVSIKCPLVQPLNATQQEVNDWIKNLKRGTGKVEYNNISDEEAFRIGREQVSALDLNEININSDKYWGLYSGLVKVTGRNMVVKVSVVHPHIVLDVWADDLKQTTGFIAYISNLINIALEVSYKMVRRTEDISNKIVSLMKASTQLDVAFGMCKNRGSVSGIISQLSSLEVTLGDSYSDTSLIRSMKKTCSNLEGTIDPDAPICENDANDLEFRCLVWLRKIHELVQYNIKTYQETFDDLSSISDDFMEGSNAIAARIAERERDYALGILVYLMILDIKSGICVFEKNLGDLNINPDLIGGFLHALQSFGLELSKSDAAMKRLTYERYQFQIETGKLVRAALILGGTPNFFITSRLERFVEQFEQNFGEDLKTFAGNMDTFKPAKALFNAFFK